MLGHCVRCWPKTESSFCVCWELIISHSNFVFKHQPHVWDGDLPKAGTTPDRSLTRRPKIKPTLDFYPSDSPNHTHLKKLLLFRLGWSCVVLWSLCGFFDLRLVGCVCVDHHQLSSCVFAGLYCLWHTVCVNLSPQCLTPPPEHTQHPTDPVSACRITTPCLKILGNTNALGHVSQN